MTTIPHNIFISSPKSLLISFEFKEFNRESIKVLQTVKAEIEHKFKDKVSYITSAFDSLLVTLDENYPNLKDLKAEFETILKDYSIDSNSEDSFKTYEIPVCYKTFGQDLDSLSKHSGVDVDEIIKIHSEKIYTLYFIGFLPGFLYMGKVDERIRIPRLKKPRFKVEKGSIGIAESQTGIYPNASPGGWQIIGRTPVDIFNVNKNPPSLFKPGDQIKFKPIDKTTFNKIINETNPELREL